MILSEVIKKNTRGIKMAKVNLKESEVLSCSGKEHKTCDCNIKIIRTNYDKLIQIDTLGSSSRKEKGTVSQSIQLDKNDIEYLIKIYDKYLK